MAKNKKTRRNARKAGGKRVLIVVTSTEQYESSGYRTGLWLGELTHFYDVLEEAGHDLTIASIVGGFVPLDPESLGTLILRQGGTHKRYRDRTFMSLLDDTVSIDEVAHRDFDAIYLTGGHGVMYDYPSSRPLAKLISRIYQDGGVVSAVCHGPAGLLDVTLKDGTPLLEGRKVTGFSWPEEKLAGRADHVPFRLDKELEKRGAKYKKALRPMAEKVVRDGNLVTGQNPMSSTGVADEVLKLLR